jgi:hypothetical protein
MEVQFSYTFDDCLRVAMRVYRDWLYSRRALSGSEYVLCWLLFALAVLGGVGCLVLLAWSIWQSEAWYWVVGPLVGLPFFVGMVLEIQKPRRGAVRGLNVELIFRLGMQEQLIERTRRKYEAHYRDQQAKGQMPVAARSLLRIDPDGLTIVGEYPACRQELRRAWSEVTAIDLEDEMVFFQIGDRGYDVVPYSAFADETACRQFARVAEGYRRSAAAVNANWLETVKA